MSQPPYPSSWPDPSAPASQPAPGPPPGAPQWNPPPAPPPFYPTPGPPGYGQSPPAPGFGYYGYPPPPPKQNSLAVTAMVVSIGSAVFLACAFCFTMFAVVPLGGGVTGAILGFVGRRQIHERGERGEGMALAGIIVGIVTAALAVLLLGITLLWFGVAFRSNSFS